MKCERSLLTSLILASSIALLAACGAKVDTSPEGPSPSPTPAGSVASLTTIPASLAQSATSTCSQPHGSVATYDSVPTLSTMLVGAWLFCGGDLKLGNGATWAGLEFTADGSFYYLTTDSAGNIVRGTGIEATATYDILPFVHPEYNDVSGQINVTFANESVMPTRATFESGPSRLALEDIDGYFVPVTP